MKRAILLCALLPSTAFAFRPLATCPVGGAQTWQTDSVTMTLVSGQFPNLGAVITPGMEEAATDALEEWGTITDAMSVNVMVGPSLAITANNGINEVGYSTSVPPGLLALTDVKGRSCNDLQELHEADIWLGNDHQWRPGPLYYDYRDAQHAVDQVHVGDVLRREMGTALGLGSTGMGVDSEAHLATMNPTYQGTSNIADDLQVHGDDRMGLRILYPTTLTPQDLSVQSRVYDGIAHLPAFCSVYSRPLPFSHNDLDLMAASEFLPAGACPQTEQSEDAPDLTVYPGSTLELRFNLVNLGTSAFASDAAVYLESRNVGQPWGDPVEVHRFQTVLLPGAPLLQDVVVELPVDLEPGRYRAFLEIDADDVVGEIGAELNNVAEWQQDIVIEELPDGCGCASGPSSPIAGLAPLLALLGLRRRR